MPKQLMEPNVLKILAMFLAVLVGAPLAARAADLGRSNMANDSYEAPVKADFSGLYMGMGVGGQYIDAGDTIVGLSGSLHVGYDAPVTSVLRLGVYAEGGFGELDSNSMYFGGAGVRFGAIVAPGLLTYAKAGYELSRVDSSVDLNSYVVGGGFEKSISSRWAVGLDASYLIPDSITANGHDVDSSAVDDNWRLLARVTYRP
jgi:hypothetical protein